MLTFLFWKGNQRSYGTFSGVRVLVNPWVLGNAQFISLSLYIYLWLAKYLGIKVLYTWKISWASNKMYAYYSWRLVIVLYWSTLSALVQVQLEDEEMLLFGKCCGKICELNNIVCINTGKPCKCTLLPHLSFSMSPGSDVITKPGVLRKTYPTQIGSELEAILTPFCFVFQWDNEVS